MRSTYLQPEFQKILQALVWFCKRNKDQMNKMKALKLLFFADRYHVRKYGRLVSSDNYVAMEYGPVGSTTRDVLEQNDITLSKSFLEYVNQYIQTQGYEFSCSRDIDADEFSQSDIEALEFALKTFGNFNQYELADITHDYPEWKEYERFLKTNNSYPIDPLKFFSDPDLSQSPHIQQFLDGEDVFRLINAELVESNKQQFIENQKIDEAWQA
jgi:uncharacterized phage-associated protein